MNKLLGRPCAIADCERLVDKSGGRDMCSMHYQRFRKHGSPSVVLRGGASLELDRNPNWTGDAASYAAVHLRLKRHKGRAANLTCVDCSKRAAHWSYDYSDPHQLVDPKCGAYSPDLDRYAPRCVSCHRIHDNARRALLIGDRP